MSPLSTTPAHPVAQTLSPATLGGWTFTLNPNEVAWTYATKTMVQNTVGGKVVQVFGKVMSDLVVRGSFGSGYTTLQKQFFNQVETWCEAQTGSPQGIPAGGQMVFNGPPLSFVFPAHGWNMKVYIVRFDSEVTHFSVVLTNSIVAPGYELTFCVVTTSSSTQLLTSSTATMIAALQRVSATFGYFPSRTNLSGPVTKSLGLPSNPAGGD